MAYSRIMSLVCWRKTSELGLRPGLASLSLPDMGKSPCSVWICFAYSHINSTFFSLSLLVCVYESALKGKEYSLCGYVWCAHIPVLSPPPPFFLSRKCCQYPALCWQILRPPSVRLQRSKPDEAVLLRPWFTVYCLEKNLVNICILHNC